MVQFDDIDEFYPPNVDISPSYVLSSDFVPSSRDWVGLYKVGWQSSRDYYTFEWAPAISSEDRRVQLTFKARRLPTKEDGTGYQFCYVSRDGNVRGVSSTFQVSSQPLGNIDDDDLECLEMEDDGMASLMLIRSKNQEVEDELLLAKEETSKLKSLHQQVETEREALKERLTVTEAEKETLVSCIEDATTNQSRLQQELQQKLAERGDLKKQLEIRDDRVKELEEEVGALNARIKESYEGNAGLQKKLADTQEQSQALATKLQDSEREVQSLQASIAAVQQQTSQLKTSYEVKDNEADVLKQRIYDLQGEKEAVALRLKESDSRLQETTAINLQLNDQLAVESSESQKLRSQLTETEGVQLEHQRMMKQHADQLSMNLADANAEILQLKDHVLILQEELESTKKSLELSQADANIAQQNVIEVMGNQEVMRQELEERKEELVRLQSQPRGGSGNNGSMFAFNVAHQQTARQREQLKQEKEALRRELSESKRKEAVLKQSLQQLKEQVNESGVRDENIALKEQVVDLNRRLQMGGDVYKEKYIECRELSLKVKKLQEVRRRTSSQPELEDDFEKVTRDLETAKKAINSLQRENEELKATVVTSNEPQMERLRQENERQHGKLMELQATLEAQTQPEVERLRQENETLHGKVMELQATIDVLNDSHPSFVHVTSSQPDSEEQEHMEQLAAELRDRRQRENGLKEDIEKLEAEKGVLEEEKKQLAELLEQVETKKTEEVEGIVQDLHAQMEQEVMSRQSMEEDFSRKEREMMGRLEESDMAFARQMEELERVQAELDNVRGSRI